MIHGFRGTAHGVNDAFVILEGVQRRHVGIAPAMVEQQLSVMGEECAQIRIRRVHDGVFRLFGARDAGIEIERPPVPGGVLVHDILKVIEDVGRGIRTGAQHTPTQLSAGDERRKQLGARARIPPRSVHLPRRLHLGSGQA